MAEFDVIIVGAGISGLSAAKWLIEAGVKALVLEATARVGGRTFTKRDPNVNYVDLGGAYVGPTQDYILRMAKSLGIETYKVHEVEDLVYYRNGHRSRYKPDGSPFYKNPFVNIDINRFTSLMDKLGKEIPSDAPWKAPKASEWDKITFREFLKKKCWTQAGIDNISTSSRINAATESYEISALGYLWYVKQCGGERRINATENGAQERKFKGGSQQISEKLAERLGENVVLKNSPVVAINQESNDFVVIKTLEGKEYKAKYIILACPPAVQTKIHFTPSLPPLRNQLMQKLPMGSCTKAIIYYKTTFWRDYGISGTMFIEGDDSHPLCTTMDDTKPDGTFPAIIGFISGDKCRRLSSLSPLERRDRIARSLAEVTGVSEFLKPIHYEEKNWMEEQYTGGGYTATYPTGYFMNYGDIIRTPIDRLYFAGTETAVQWSGYMDGAVAAGERAAREVLHSMGKIPQDQIWQKDPSMNVIAVPFQETNWEKYTPFISGFLKIGAISTIFGAAALMFMNCKDIMKTLLI